MYEFEPRLTLRSLKAVTMAPTGSPPPGPSWRAVMAACWEIEDAPLHAVRVKLRELLRLSRLNQIVKAQQPDPSWRAVMATCWAIKDVPLRTKAYRYVSA